MNKLVRAGVAFGAAALVLRGMPAPAGDNIAGRRMRWGVAVAVAIGAWLAAPTVLGDGKAL